ncbi:DUF4192 domain-containing protein [Gordonia soli]|uniref:DUF4192 domain-containing protein n=1 Tax=Gordonia soli NBRC 108243 TaxID=1223545 RepID=M0QJX8_9ACTN|nr:DUF4192 domain-containing protein [Gordonia soli]GAC68915.1 hypothetical protein GS4_19_01050 [Gordonia soli NBRC 108243]
MTTDRRQGMFDPTTLLTALPALLGFIPERSIILIAFAADDSICATMRHDLVLTPAGAPHRSMPVLLRELGEICVRYAATSVLLVIVDDRYPGDDPRYRRIAAVADRHLAASGGVYAAFFADDLTEGRPWRTIWHPTDDLDRFPPPIVMPAGVDEAGFVRDPHTSATAMREAITSGRRILAKRSEMVAMLSETEHCDNRHHPDPDGVAEQSNSPRPSGELLQFVFDQVLAPSSALDCATVRTLERAITTLEVRDGLLALSVTDHRAAVEELWRQLARRLRGSGRASAATLLAHLHYVGGDGAYAGVALDCALTADPHWTLATLLDRALRAGLHPDVVMWPMVDDSYEVAARLGVQLPAITMRDAG